MENVLTTIFALLAAFACLAAAQWFLNGLFKGKIPNNFRNALGLLAIILVISTTFYFLALGGHASDLYFLLGFCFRVAGDLISDVADGLDALGTYLMNNS